MPGTSATARGTGAAPIHSWAEARAFTISLTVTDTKGASHTATSSVAVSAALDRAPPSVTLVAPSQALPGEQVTVTADAIDNVSVASLDVHRRWRQPLVTERAVSACGHDSDGRRARHEDRGARDRDHPSNNSGSATAVITVMAAPDTEPPTVTLHGPDTASPGQTILLTADAGDNVGVASVRFIAAGASIVTDPAPAYTTTFVVPASTPVGSMMVFTARATDFSNLSADASATVAIVSAPDTTPPDAHARVAAYRA